MNENEILAEIRRTRDDHARECGYDLHVIFEQMRADTARLKTEGWQVESAAETESAVLREEPPKP